MFILIQKIKIEQIFCFNRPIILPEEDDNNDTTIDADDSEVTLEKIEEEMIAVIE